MYDIYYNFFVVVDCFDKYMTTYHKLIFANSYFNRVVITKHPSDNIDITQGVIYYLADI